jgi:hypothetical protein
VPVQWGSALFNFSSDSISQALDRSGCADTSSFAPKMILWREGAVVGGCQTSTGASRLSARMRRLPETNSTVTTMEIAACGGREPLNLTRLAEPVRIQLPFVPSTLPPNNNATAALVPCQAGVNRTVQCGSSVYNIRPQIVPVPCGAAAAAVSVTCPTVGVCVFWDAGRGAWSGEGCRTLYSAGNLTVCECHHLSTFSGELHTHSRASTPTG